MTLLRKRARMLQAIEVLKEQQQMLTSVSLNSSQFFVALNYWSLRVGIKPEITKISRGYDYGMKYYVLKKPLKPRYANKWISIKKKVRQNFIVGQPLVAWWPSWPPLSSVRYYPSIIIRGNFTFFFSQPAGQTRWIIIPTPTVSKKTLTFFCCNYQ